MSKGISHSEIARMLGVTEGAVRHQVKRIQAAAVDGRTRQEPRVTLVAEEIEHWRDQRGERPVNLAAPHDWLVAEHGHSGSLRSVRRFWGGRYPHPCAAPRSAAAAASVRSPQGSFDGSSARG